MSFEPSLVRRGLDYLLDAYPMFDLVSVNWQLPEPIVLYSEGVPARRWEGGIVGPWVLVKLGQPSETMRSEPLILPAWATWEFAIWKVTGAVYRVGADGAVPDDPIWQP
jgi:hypothetical protein